LVSHAFKSFRDLPLARPLLFTKTSLPDEEAAVKRYVTCLLVGSALVWPAVARAETDDEHEAEAEEREHSNESSRWTSESNSSSSSRHTHDDGGSARSHRSPDAADHGGAVTPRDSRDAGLRDGAEPMTHRAPPSWHTRLSTSRSGEEQPERAHFENMQVRSEGYRPGSERAEVEPGPSVAHQEPLRPPIDRDGPAANDPDDDEADERPRVATAEHRRDHQRRHAAVSDVAVTVVDVAARSLCLSRCTQSFAVRPRLGAAFLARTDSSMGSLDAGIGLGYLLVPRISLELRGDFLIPFTGETAQGLDSIWLSLNLVWVFVDGRVVRPYVVVGVDMAVVPGDAEQNVETIVAGGGQAGLGLEVVLGSFVGVNLEVLGVVSGTAGEVLEGGVNATASVSFYF
jgi:hypothetical protein